jgi:hypothetical protein
MLTRVPFSLSSMTEPSTSPITPTWADGGYAGKPDTRARSGLKLTTEIIRRPDEPAHLQIPPRGLGHQTGSRLDQPPPPHHPRLRNGRPPATRLTSTGQ